MSTNGGNRYQWDSGKGSWKRPREVSKQKYEENWDRIFKKKVDADPEKIEEILVAELPEAQEGCDVPRLFV